jgi:hypothetical protein
MGNAFVSDDVLVGSMTLLDAEVYPSGATLVGSPCTHLGLRPPLLDAPDQVGRVTRVALDWFFILWFIIMISASLAPPIVFLHWLTPPRASARPRRAFPTNFRMDFHRRSHLRGGF